MSTTWMLDTHGDPLAVLRRVLHRVWDSAGLDAMLVPANGRGDGTPRVLRDPSQLAGVNPFRPLMTSSTARMVPELVGARPLDLVGILVRPCYMRSLVEMTKHDGFTMDALVTVCVDCLSTLSVGEYRWRVERQGTGDAMADEALRHASHGGFVPYRYRAACQQCTSPCADTVDVNIGVLGLPAREHMLVWSRDDEVALRLGLDRESATVAPETLVAAHRRSLCRGRHRALAGLLRRVRHVRGGLPERAAAGNALRERARASDRGNRLSSRAVAGRAVPV